MADEPKKPEKPGGDKPSDKAPAPSAKDPLTEMIILVVGMMLALYVLNGIINTVSSSSFFTRGWDGWTPQGIVRFHTRPLDSLLNPVGVSVIALRDISVYEDPGVGQIGTQEFNAQGTVLQGPYELYGQGYYDVDFEKDPDGWVHERDIGYVEGKLSWFERIIIFLFSAVAYIKFVLLGISILLAGALVYVFRHLRALRANEHTLMYPEAAGSTEPGKIVNQQWEKIVAHSESQNENDWRLAILEADIMLDRLLDSLSLPGDTMADKLKAVEKSDFTTIDLAWEAHKIRNQIAHEGSEFKLNQRETRRVISLYQEVFNEFQII